MVKFIRMSADLPAAACHFQRRLAASQVPPFRFERRQPVPRVPRAWPLILQAPHCFSDLPWLVMACDLQKIAVLRHLINLMQEPGPRTEQCC